MLDNQLDKKEIKTVKRYYLLSTLALPSFVLSIIIFVEFFLLYMINESLFNGYTEDIYFLVWLILCLGSLIYFSVAAIVPRVGMNGKRWATIVKKANRARRDEQRSQEIEELSDLVETQQEEIGVLDHNPNIHGTTSVLRSTTKNIRQACQEIADQYGIHLPNCRRTQMMGILIPTVCLLLAFIPQFYRSNHLNKYEKETIRISASKIADSLETVGLDVYEPDLEGELYRYNYVYGYADDENDINIDVSINEFGQIVGFSYHLEIIDESFEEIVTYINDFSQKCVTAVDQSEVENLIPEHEKYVAIPEEFVGALLEQSVNEELHLNKDVEVENGTRSVSFSYRPYDTEYDLNPRIYYSVRFYAYEEY